MKKYAIHKAVETYKCPGCVCGSSVEDECYNFHVGNGDCIAHVAGTYATSIGKILLGMPRGFDRLEPLETKNWKGFKIFKNEQNFERDFKGYNKFNVPVWKYLDEHGNTLIRGIMPRINCPFIHIFLGNRLDKIECLEITHQDIKEMD